MGGDVVLSAGWYVLELFLNNPSSFFSVSDVMREVNVSWVTANDNMLSMMRLGLLERCDGKYCFNSGLFVVKKT